VTKKQRLDLDNYLPYLLNRVGFAMVESFTKDALKANDLSIDMWRVLAALSNADELRQVDLSAKTTIDASTMSRIVSRLVHMGYVTRSRSKASSREVVVALAPKGIAFIQRTIPIAHQLEDTTAADLPAKDLAVVKRALCHFYDNLAKVRAAR
jgi:DNA-binding MarR family transcriptional regulator